ncbi:MAG TPA: phosphoribosylformylglycinamidine synthase II, partial [Rhodospirillales bacterium]|nr:phosphoribosylformylglycinamidine synthase II [Rhodospirillales bacterium]
LMAALETLIGCPDLASKRWIWEQYDHMVMGDTIARPGGDAAIVRIHGTKKGLAMTSDCTPRYCLADPVEGGRQAVAEAWRNLTAVGAKPLAVTDNMNFGNPEKPEIMGQFVGCIEGMRDACKTLDFPVVSGNVSLYNETNGQAILPTPVIGAVGLLEDSSQAIDLAFKAAGEAIILIGETEGHFGASLYLREIEGREDGAPPPVDLGAERRNGNFVRSLILNGQATACHDLSGGGLAVGLARMAMASGIGADIELAIAAVPLHGLMFAEDQGRYLLTAANPEDVLSAAKKSGVPAERIGTTGGGHLTVNGSDSISVSELKSRNEAWLPGYMSAP